MFRSILVSAIALGVAGSAQGAVLFSQNFDSLSPALSLGGSALPGFTIAGNVDLVSTGTFGITCAGNCVDLDGTTGPGALTTRSIYFVKGKPVTVSFDVGGNQRDAGPDDFVASVSFMPANGGSAAFISGPASFDPGYLNMLNGVSYVESIGGSRPFLTYSYTFTAAVSGTFQMTFGTTSGDNIGPLLDNVLVTGSVPEPASWAMLISGFGLVGATLRRRRMLAA